MKDRPISHRPAQISAKTAIHGHSDLQALNQSGGIEANLIAVMKGMAFAGDHEVVITIKP